MKLQSIFIFLCILPLLSFAQRDKEEFLSPPTVEGKVVYSGVVKVDSISQTELYIRAKRYFVDTYKSANDVIQLDDKASGEVTGKSILEFAWYQGSFSGYDKGKIYMTTSIYVKDGKYKYEIRDILLKVDATKTKEEHNNPIELYLSDKDKRWKRMLTGVHKAVVLVVDQLIESMKNKKNDF